MIQTSNFVSFVGMKRLLERKQIHRAINPQAVTFSLNQTVPTRRKRFFSFCGAQCIQRNITRRFDLVSTDQLNNLIHCHHIPFLTIFLSFSKTILFYCSQIEQDERSQL